MCWDACLEVLLAAFQRLQDQSPKVTLVLVGGGGEEDRIRSLARVMGLAQHVIFTGFLENPARIYPPLDLYLFDLAQHLVSDSSKRLMRANKV